MRVQDQIICFCCSIPLCCLMTCIHRFGILSKKIGRIKSKGDISRVVSFLQKHPLKGTRIDTVDVFMLFFFKYIYSFIVC